MPTKTPIGSSEHSEQCALIQRCQLNEGRWPELKLIYAVPNAQNLTPRQGKWMKDEGKKAGVPDICLPVGKETSRLNSGIVLSRFNALYIELKVGKNKTSEAQDAYIELLRKYGNKVVVCYGADEAWAAIEEYLRL